MQRNILLLVVDAGNAVLQRRRLAVGSWGSSSDLVRRDLKVAPGAPSAVTQTESKDFNFLGRPAVAHHPKFLVVTESAASSASE